MVKFVAGLELAQAFYVGAVRPILADAFPDLAHAAALIGTGSEVLGLDTDQSSDHHWGPRVQMFLGREDHARCAIALVEELARRLPPTFRGYATNFGEPDEGGTRLLAPVAGPPIAHRVEVLELGDFLETQLGFDPRGSIEVVDWLLTPSQRLLELTAGAVFHDGAGELTRVRASLAWYPHDVWLYLIACQWQRIAEEEAFVGRAGQVGDELGSAVVAARLVRDVMRLCFLLERRYAPYSKWLGSAFARLECADALAPVLRGALAAADVHERERYLATAYEMVAAQHNRLGVSAPVDPATRPYYNRPFRVLRAERLAEATRAAIRDHEVLRLPRMGSVDQFADSTAVLSWTARWRKLAGVYQPDGPLRRGSRA